MKRVREFARERSIAVSKNGVIPLELLELFVREAGPDEEVEDAIARRLENRKTVFDRFFEKVDAQGFCWLWVAAKCDQGYGRFFVDKARGVVGAHRVCYELLVGPIPAGLDLDHLCRVPACVNPDHLEPVSHRVNALRGYSPMAANARRELCVHGHELDGTVKLKNGSTRRYCKQCYKKPLRPNVRRNKFSAEQIVAIKDRFAEGGITQTQLAEQHGVDTSIMSQILGGRSYRWADDRNVRYRHKNGLVA